MGRLFGEFTTGQRFETPGRTITETDIVAFAGLTGDYNPVHTDEVFAADTEFGRWSMRPRAPSRSCFPEFSSLSPRANIFITGMKAGLNLFRPILGACSLRHKANWFSELRCADSLRPRMMVFATSRCARAVCHATAPVGETIRALDYHSARG